ncbi:uncharacterized protein LOC135825245 [Sycon ciliatum]|uniref:uncharacterized protein LOC135825245 n=1 Tax=Sycon ciliatum TaxID=27933 RepID=UPI0031F6653B
MEQELVTHGLNSVIFDVWEAAVLPFLSLVDIFQLCGVTRHVRNLLHTENTFRRLCQNRYQISPNLKLSFILVAKHLSIATRVSSIHRSKNGADHHWTVPVVDCYDPHHHAWVFNQKLRTMVQLASLELMSPNSNTLIRCSPPLVKPLIKELWLPSKNTSSFLLNLPTSLIEEKCRLGERTMHSLNDATSLLLKICGSHEEYQTCILKKMEQDSPRIESCLPYANRSGKLVELAKCFECVARRDPTLLSSLKCENLVPTLPQHITTRWIYNPYDYILIKNDKSDFLSDDVLATQNWIDFTVKLAECHSVLKLLIRGRLRVWQFEDYFAAVMEYDELWHSLPHSSRPSQEVLYRDLGSYLLSTIPMSQELRKEELLNAMEQCGKKTVDSATRKVCDSASSEVVDGAPHEVCCCARAPCCVLL